MMAYEMVGIADQNNRTYVSKYGTYNKETGFLLNPESSHIGKCELLDKMFHENCWSLKNEPKKMTKEEIEKALGYEIEIQESSKQNNSQIKEDRKDTYDLLKELLCGGCF